MVEQLLADVAASDPGWRIALLRYFNPVGADASGRITIALDYADDRLSLDYSDDGRGFMPGAMMDIGMGLSNISSRISSLKGRCDIRSENGQGMHAAISVNLKDKDGNVLTSASTKPSFSSIIPSNSLLIKLVLSPEEKLESGDYSIASEVSTEDGEILATKDISFKIE